MDKTLEIEINALITNRILAYHSRLIKSGQIDDIALKGPSAIHPPSHCNQSGHKRQDGRSEGPVLHQGEPLQSH